MIAKWLLLLAWLCVVVSLALAAMHPEFTGQALIGATSGTLAAYIAGDERAKEKQR